MPRPRKPAGEKYTSPQIVLRLPGDLKPRLESAAQAEGKTLTQLLVPILRRALQRCERKA